MKAPTLVKASPQVLSAARELRHRTLDSIQYLRGIAAMLVVFYHVFPQIQRMGFPDSGPEMLSYGVDIFFVISGFVMVYSTARHPGRGGMGFLRDRIVRIVPLYWALSLVMLAILLLVPAVAQSSFFDPRHIIASFLFIPWLHPVQHQYWPMLVPGWTLNYEMFFYLIFAIALGIAAPRRGLVVALAGAVLVGLTMVPLFMPMSGVAAFYTRSQILEFGYGMVLGELFLRTDRSTSRAWWLAIVVGAAGLVLSPLTRQLLTQGFAVGVPALLIVLGALYVPLDLKGGWERLARKLGDASYSIYLSHYIFMSALGQIWRRLLPGGSVSWVSFAVFAVFACALAGIVVYHLIERPLGALADRWLGKAHASESRPLAFVVAPSGQAGGGMGRVKDYILSFDDDGTIPMEFRPLVTRDYRGFCASLWLTAKAVGTIWDTQLTGRLGLVHINLGDKASALRKGVVTLLARASGATVVVHLHAVELEAGWRKSSVFVQWLIGLPFRLASTNIVLGDNWRDWLVDDLGVPLDRVDVLANGVPVPPYQGRDHRAPRAAVHLLFLGNLLERKGVSDLIAALAALRGDLPRWRLTFAGGGDLPGYREAVKNAGLEDRVDFLGWVDQESAQELLAAADVLVLPSYHEGLPLVILEALGAGTPVITTSVGAIPQFIKAERDALIVVPGERGQLATALSRLIGNSALRQEVCDRGRETYEQVFSLAAFRANLFDIYRKRLGIFG